MVQIYRIHTSGKMDDSFSTGRDADLHVHRSPSLLPKPDDWQSNVSVTGFAFLDSKTSFSAPDNLVRFLANGSPPVYVGFGSIVVADPLALMKTVLEAVKLTGRRLILSLGWAAQAELIEKLPPLPVAVHLLSEDCPHDWLFPQVSCVVHHGGAGTTAAGLRAGRPSVVVPFFGDQFFWGDKIWRAGAGPQPIPHRELTVENLNEALNVAAQVEVHQRAEMISKGITAETGSVSAARSFLAQLPASKMSCHLMPSRVAAWEHKTLGLRLSALAATVLHKQNAIDWKDLETYQVSPRHVSQGAVEPVSGAAWAVTDLLVEGIRGMGEIVAEVGNTPFATYKVFAKTRSKMTESKTVAEATDPARNRITGSRVDDYQRHRSITKSTTPGKLPGEFFVTGASRVLKAAARAPGAFAAGMADGSHNLPHLWGDKSVRDPVKVTGLASGVTGGCKELVWGVADGISGIFVLPIVGAKREGALGFFKGAGQGALGLPVKFFAGKLRDLDVPFPRASPADISIAANGIVGYPLKGVDIAVSQALGVDDMKEVRFQRMLQGESEYPRLSDAEKEGIVRRWQELLVQ
jgi:hypothetical protein